MSVRSRLLPGHRLHRILRALAYGPMEFADVVDEARGRNAHRIERFKTRCALHQLADDGHTYWEGGRYGLTEAGAATLARLDAESMARV